MSNINQRQPTKKLEIKEGEMNVAAEQLLDGKDGYEQGRYDVPKFQNKTIRKNRNSGAARRKFKKINLFLDHYRESPHTFYTQNSWPAGLRNYVVRCFETCKSEEEKKLLQDLLKEKIWNLQNNGLETNWHDEPLLQLAVENEISKMRDVVVKEGKFNLELYQNQTIPSSRKSGAGKKKSKKINRLLDHYRESPHIFYTQSSWPIGLRNYVVRCFKTCKNEEEKKLLQDLLKEKIWNLQDNGLLLETNWHDEPVLQMPVKNQE